MNFVAGRCHIRDSIGNRCSLREGHARPHLIPNGQRLLGRAVVESSIVPLDQGLAPQAEE